MHADGIILGGGLIGLALAQEWTSRGHSVIVLDRPAAGPIASWSASGSLPAPAQCVQHDPLEQLRKVSHARYETWCDELHDLSGVDVEFRRSGGIYLARTPGEKGRLAATISDWQRDGIVCEEWTPADLAAREPELAQLTPSTQIVFCPDEWKVRPPRLLEALQTILRQRSCPLVSLAETPEWQRIGSRIVGLKTTTDTYTAEHYCICAGPWSNQVLKPLGMQLALEPRRGQMVQWKLPAEIPRCVINEGVRYLISRADGWLLAGSTVEDVGFDHRTTPAAIDGLIGFARDLLPRLMSQQPERTWSGLRPMATDGTPFLGPIPGLDNVWTATGHFRSGIHLAPVTATLMSDLMERRIPEIDPTPFALSR